MNPAGAGGYRWDAEEYARNSQAQLGWARELIEKLALRGDESVLDIGSGDGKVSAELARKVPRGRVVAIDSSEDMVQMATSAFPPASFHNLVFRRMDARSLPFEGAFDVAFSNATLHWLTDHRPMLAGVARSLRPGGKVLFQMGGRGNGEEIFQVAFELIRANPWRDFFEGFQFPWGFYGPEDYRPWCAEAGISIARLALVPKDMAQKGAEGLAGWVRTTWMPFTERLPEERREQFISEVVRRYLEGHPLDARGNATVRMVRLEIEATAAALRR
jgi:trans-aconitate 2-methyltransferase